MRNLSFIAILFLFCSGIYGYTLDSDSSNSYKQPTLVKHHFAEELKGNILNKMARYQLGEFSSGMQKI